MFLSRQYGRYFCQTLSCAGKSRISKWEIHEKGSVVRMGSSYFYVYGVTVKWSLPLKRPPPPGQPYQHPQYMQLTRRLTACSLSHKVSPESAQPPDLLPFPSPHTNPWDNVSTAHNLSCLVWSYASLSHIPASPDQGICPSTCTSAPQSI